MIESNFLLDFIHDTVDGSPCDYEPANHCRATECCSSGLVERDYLNTRRLEGEGPTEGTARLPSPPSSRWARESAA